MQRTSVPAAALALAATLAGAPAGAYLIDFETIPGASPVEGMPITNQWAAAYATTFSQEGGDPPLLAQVGSPQVAFRGPPGNTTEDTPAPGQDIGNFFLADNPTGPAPLTLLLSFGVPMAQVAGELIDVDVSALYGPEAFTIEARGDHDQVLESIDVVGGQPGTGDGIATPWSFSHIAADIFSVRIAYSGEKPVNVGVGFDNFSLFSPLIPTPEPTPLAGFALVGAAALSLRRARGSAMR